MNQDIRTIELVFEDGNNIILEKRHFSHFYIGNIDKNSDEIRYEKILDTNVLFANFFKIKLNSLVNRDYDVDTLNMILDKKNLAEINIYMKNNTCVSFCIASSVNPFNDDFMNSYDKSFFIDEDLCILISPFDLKYKNSLFI